MSGVERRRMLIEFIGLPGSGKTSLSSRINDLLRAEQVRVFNPTREISRKGAPARLILKFWHCLSAILTNPRDTLALLRLVYLTRQKSWQDFMKVSINIIYVVDICRRSSRKDGVVLLDQGLFQGLWSIAYSSDLHTSDTVTSYSNQDKLKTLIADIISCLILPQLIVEVGCEPEVLAARLTGREKKVSRLGAEADADAPGGEPAPDIESNLERGGGFLKMVRKLAGEKSGVEIIRAVNNQPGDLQRNSREIRDIILSRIDR